MARDRPSVKKKSHVRKPNVSLEKNGWALTDVGRKTQIAVSAYRCWEEDTDCCCCFSVVVPMLIVKWWTTDWSLMTILSTTCPASISSRTRVDEANEGARGSQIVALASFAFLPFFSNKISPSKTFAISLGSERSVLTNVKRSLKSVQSSLNSCPHCEVSSWLVHITILLSKATVKPFSELVLTPLPNNSRSRSGSSSPGKKCRTHLSKNSLPSWCSSEWHRQRLPLLRPAQNHGTDVSEQPPSPFLLTRTSTCSASPLEGFGTVI